jgi:hypothetical protein
MRDRIMGHLTYANVMSTLAVFGMLATGSAFAASQIGTSDIKNGAVTAGKLHNDAVTTRKIKNGAVTGAKIDASSLGQVPSAAHADTAGGARPTGAAGGDLTGTYPSPIIAAGSVTANKLAPLGDWIPIDLSGLPPSVCGPSSRYLAYGNGYDTPAYRLDAYGVVHLRGAVGCAPSTGSPKGFEFLFTLPPGYRPLTKEMFAVASAGDPNTRSTYLDGAVEVDPDGTVEVNGGMQTFYSLAGVEFDTLH